jgi:predicted Rossmann fold nucleotide-binding protein DprA/Smf involved in DNA uptake
MVDFLDEKRKEIDARLKELRPLVDEYNRLEKAASALAGVGVGTGVSASGAARSETPRRRRGRPRATAGAAAATTGTTRRGRPRGSGTRGKQALELVKSKPGITIAELAEAMGIKANYLYRVMPSLETEGQVTKRDGGWHPV